MRRDACDMEAQYGDIRVQQLRRRKDIARKMQHPHQDGSHLLNDPSFQATAGSTLSSCWFCPYDQECHSFLKMPMSAPHGANLGDRPT